MAGAEHILAQNAEAHAKDVKLRLPNYPITQVSILFCLLLQPEVHKSLSLKCHHPEAVEVFEFYLQFGELLETVADQELLQNVFLFWVL